MSTLADRRRDAKNLPVLSGCLASLMLVTVGYTWLDRPSCNSLGQATSLTIVAIGLVSALAAMSLVLAGRGSRGVALVLSVVAIAVFGLSLVQFAGVDRCGSQYSGLETFFAAFLLLAAMGLAGLAVAAGRSRRPS